MRQDKSIRPDKIQRTLWVHKISTIHTHLDLKQNHEFCKTNWSDIIRITDKNYFVEACFTQLCWLELNWDESWSISHYEYRIMHIKLWISHKIVNAIRIMWRTRFDIHIIRCTMIMHKIKISDCICFVICGETPVKPIHWMDLLWANVISV